MFFFLTSNFLKYVEKKNPIENTMLFHSLVEDCALGVLVVNKSFWEREKSAMSSLPERAV